MIRFTFSEAELRRRHPHHFLNLGAKERPSSSLPVVRSQFSAPQSFSSHLHSEMYKCPGDDGVTARSASVTITTPGTPMKAWRTMPRAYFLSCCRVYQHAAARVNRTMASMHKSSRTFFIHFAIGANSVFNPFLPRTAFSSMAFII